MSQSSTVEHADNWEKVLFLFLGWLLATASPLIADVVRRRRETRETKTALLGELAELKYRMALVVYFVEARYGRFNRALLEWLNPIVTAYRGPLPADTIAELVAAQLRMSDGELEALAQAKRNVPNKALTLKRYPAPFLESRLQSLAWLPSAVQALMIEIHTHLAIAEAEIENIQYYFRMTFDSSVNGENRNRVEENLESGYQNYTRSARTIVDNISKLERAWA